MKRKLLFVCSANRLRSRTAYDYFKDSDKYIVDSCGLDRFSVEKTQREVWADAKTFNKHLYDEADIVFCMETQHAMEIKRRAKDGNWSLDKTKMLVLNIPDIYNYNDPELITLLDTKVSLLLSEIPTAFPTIPENLQKVFETVPLRIKIRSVLKQNDVANWVDGKWVGDSEQLENTVKALEIIVNQHFKD